jgi:hypothetical protein
MNDLAEKRASQSFTRPLTTPVFDSANAHFERFE